jgi:hypothetical protein
VARRVGVVAALRDEAHLVDGLAAAVARARAIAREAGARTPA